MSSPTCITLAEADRCPRFHTCNAAVCPLESTLAAHLPGDRVCYYLLASGKAGADERFQDDPVFADCRDRLPEVAYYYPEIRRAVDRAAQSGFRGGNLIDRGSRLRPVDRAVASGNGDSDGATLGCCHPDDVPVVSATRPSERPSASLSYGPKDDHQHHGAT
jgi:hypothetical protein